MPAIILAAAVMIPLGVGAATSTTATSTTTDIQQQIITLLQQLIKQKAGEQGITNSQQPTDKTSNGNNNQQKNPMIMGKVTAVSGTTITITSNYSSTVSSTGELSTQTATTYTVDASSATVTKDGASSTVSAIAVDDEVSIEGTVSGTTITAKTVRVGKAQGEKQGNGTSGTVTAVSGTTIIMTGKVAPSTSSSTTTTTTYTVDASSATVTKNGATSTVSAIAIGDEIMVQGTVSGTTITATAINIGGAQLGSGQQPGNQGGQAGRVLNENAPGESINIDAKGNATIRGTLTAISGTTITVESWDVTFTVDISSAKFVGQVTDTSSMQTGDIIGLQAKLTSGSSSIAATVVRDWSVSSLTKTTSTTSE